MAPDLTVAANLGVAGLAGLAVGVEREWSGHATGPHARFAGVRTFLLMGLLGGAAGWLASQSMVPLAAVMVAGGAGLTVIAYWQAVARSGERLDGTTEAAALLVLALGLLAGLGHITLAAGGAALVAFALAEKGPIHRAVRRIGAPEMLGALEFAVLALVVLPLLPEGPIGPLGGVRPRLLWTVVLLFSGLNFLGYVARRHAGTTRGVAITGLLGGALSSTAVTLEFARLSRREPALAQPLAVGAAAACGILLLRAGIVTAVLEPPAGAALAPYLLAPLVVAAATTLPFLFRHPRGGHEPRAQPAALRNPLALRSAIVMAVALAALQMAFTIARQAGGGGLKTVIPAAAALGLTDVDALLFAITQFAKGGGPVGLAALAIGVGIIANTVLKIGIGLFGSPRFRRGLVWRLALQGAALAGALWIGVKLGL